MDDLDDFSEFEAKVNELANLCKSTSSMTDEEEDIQYTKVTSERSVLNRKRDDDDKPSTSMPDCAQMDAATFMKQTEEDAKERARQREDRESLAKNLKIRASIAFRKKDFEEATVWYTKAIEQVKDSVSSHANRALCFYRLKNYTRCMNDCDFVLDKLHEYNIRVLIYRAACYKHMNDNRAFEETIQLAKQHHPQRLELIDKFAEKINAGEF